MDCDSSFDRYVAESLRHLEQAGELPPEQHLQAAQVKATLALAAATLAAQAPSEPGGQRVKRDGHVDQLRDQILREGGRWGPKRVWAFFVSVGFSCELNRAGTILREVAEANPELLVPVEGKPWTFDVAEELPQPDTAEAAPAR